MKSTVYVCEAERMLTIEEMKASGKANKPGATAKAVPIEPTQHRVKRSGRGPGRPKNSERRQKALESQSAPPPAATVAPGPTVNHLKQFRLAFEFLHATSERDLENDFLPEDSICPPLLSEPVFTDCMPAHIKFNNWSEIRLCGLWSEFSGIERCIPLIGIDCAVEFLKIENLNPATAYDNVESTIWIATTKLDYSNRMFRRHMDR